MYLFLLQLRHADDAHGEGQDDPAGHDPADRLEVRHARRKVTHLVGRRMLLGGYQGGAIRPFFSLMGIAYSDSQ